MSIKIDQAFAAAMLNAGLQIDLVHEGGLYTVWDGANYTNYVGTYTPTAGREFAELRVFPAGKIPHSLADSDEAVGLFQSIVKYPSGAGAWNCKRKAEEIMDDVLSVGRTLTHQEQKVFIVSNSRDGGRDEGGYYQIVVRANYRAYTARV